MRGGEHCAYEKILWQQAIKQIIYSDERREWRQKSHPLKVSPFIYSSQLSMKKTESAQLLYLLKINILPIVLIEGPVAFAVFGSLRVLFALLVHDIAPSRMIGKDIPLWPYPEQ